jgi:hypothetical protein
MGLFRPIREGSWWVISESDPRWNCDGRGFVGGFMVPEEAEKAIKEMEEKYGKRPDDLEFGYMKD